VNEEKLSDFIAHADEIDGLKARLLQLEKLRLEEELSTTYIAFEALSSLLGGAPQWLFGQRFTSGVA
jgi:hypothetical protein